MNVDTWMPQLDQARCTGCGDCVAVCPTGALAIAAGKAILARPEICQYCLSCEDICPMDAIALPFLICKGEACEC